MIPTLILRDYGGKPVQAANLDGRESQAMLSFTFSERGAGYALEIDAAPTADGMPTADDFRVLLGRNAPEALTAAAEATGNGVISKPLVLIDNVYLKRLETTGHLEGVARIDRVFDWAYPCLYLGMVELVAVWFFV